ncbi:MAG: hypothetical protein F6J93_25355 [Oscillatoria sp. SIO1A7]|nr:hypothetical protein [Oscillatoria sp. SIO1A7]
MPNAQCEHAQCPIPNSQFPIPNSQFYPEPVVGVARPPGRRVPITNSQCPILN